MIGGGPAGLIAAGQAALSRGRVTILEKKDSPALKLRLTGNGRCNLTNEAPIEEFISHFGRQGKFLRPAFARFFASDLMRFFENLGVKLMTDSRGRVYPKSGNADEIAEALVNWTIGNGVKIACDAAALEIMTRKNSIDAVRAADRRDPRPADIVIISTGGASYPGTGSSGDGYKLAEALGHTIVPVRPASVPLLTSPAFAPKLQGISLNSVSVTVKIESKPAHKSSGDLLFTHYGLSGPVALEISRYCVDSLTKGQRISISLDLLPEKDENQLDRLLINSFKNSGRRELQNILAELIPSRMAPAFLEEIGIEPAKFCSQVTAVERRRITQNLKGFEIEITGHRPLTEAMVTAGGVNLKEVNPNTMESRIIKGLYFAGEVLDLDADTGGFNLQAAFSTGWLAGRKCTA